MTVLITGGAGFLGINLIRHLWSRDCHQITSLDLAEFTYPEYERIRIVTGDIREPTVVAEALKGIDAVVHTASALPLYSDEDIESTIYEGTRILLEQSLKSGIQIFVYISSTAVYGIPNFSPISEKTALVGVGPYGEAKIRAEELCEKSRGKGMRISVIRPKSFIGPERLGVFEILYDWAHNGRSFPVIGKGDNHYQLLDVEDLCRFITICLMDKSERIDDVFNIGSAEFGTIREDFQAVLDAAGYGKRIVPLPAGPVKAILSLLEWLNATPIYQWVYKTAGKESVVEIRKAREITGFVPRYSNKQALLRNFEWYEDNRHLIANASGRNHRSPWKRGILTIAEKFF